MKPIVIGADGWLGQMLSARLDAHRIVFRQPRSGEIDFDSWSGPDDPQSPVINASGWRVRPGLSRDDYFRSHVDTLAVLLARLHPGQPLIHFSSASVMGAGRTTGETDRPDPASFPIPAYAEAKLAGEKLVKSHPGISSLILRPGIVYSPGGEGMIATLTSLANRRLLLHPLPGSARQHLCSDLLLGDTIAALLPRFRDFAGRTLMVADPFVLTNSQITATIRKNLPGVSLPLPLPTTPFRRLYRLFPSGSTSRTDFRTWAGIVGVWALDAAYDVSPLWGELQLPKEKYGPNARWHDTILAGLRRP